MQPDRTTNKQDGPEAADQPAELEAIRREIFGRDGRQKLNYETYANRQLVVDHNNSKHGSDNDKDKDENEENIPGQYPTVFLANAKFSGLRTLAEWRKRHDELEAYIKKTKEEIARHPKTIEKEAARKAEEEKMSIKKETDSEDEMDLDIKLD
jgi:hypothetical protein